jgi:hypothetical protein
MCIRRSAPPPTAPPSNRSARCTTFAGCFRECRDGDGVNCIMENFKFFTMYYLNDWCSTDEDYFIKLQPDKEPSVRRECMQRAATYYGIARNFRLLPNEERFASALDALDGISASFNHDVDSQVSELANTFRSAYGRNAVSAASKFLWIRHRSPIIIYDTRAIRALGGNLRDRDYSTYRREWLRQFDKHEAAIRSACSQVLEVKDWSLAFEKPEDKVRGWLSERWFHERVFDKFLWWHGES